MNEKEYNKKYYEEHKEYHKNYSKIYREKNLEDMNKQHKEYYTINRDKIRERKRLYRLKNLELLRERGRISRAKPGIKEKEKQTAKLYNQRNKQERNRKLKERYRNDIIFRLQKCLRRRSYRAFREILNVSKNKSTFEMIGCSPQELKIHIENRFVVGMTWENYGKDGWDIDHIIPLSSAKTEEEMIKLCHYTNLQPLWHIDNIKKGNKTEFRIEKN